MSTRALHDRSTDTDPQHATRAPASRGGQEWAIYQVQGGDVAAVKRLFRRLHDFNAALDRRFALSKNWEAHFHSTLLQVLHGDASLGLIARETDTDRPCGFALAAVRCDSALWRYHEWAEVEALYVEDAWRGRGLAEALLARVCAWAESVGQSVVQLYVTAGNARALAFYRHEGFRQTQAIMRKVLV